MTVLRQFAAPGAPTRLSTSPIRTARRGRRGSPLLQPGWPLVLLFVGYPLWWLLGIAQIACLAAAAVMFLELLQRRVIAAPKSFGWWLLFLAWTLVGVLLLQVNAPGAVAGSANTRYFTFAFRFSWYLAATIFLLYIGNMRRELSVERITGAFSWMFVTVVAGGIIGILVPHLNFPSALEAVLPHHLANTPFVHVLLHPTIAQLNSVGGALNARPSAPFPYANLWGLNYACLVPFFILGWCSARSGWKRVAGPVVLLVSLVPVLESQNRGLWLALIAMGVFVAVRYALAGRMKMLAGLVGIFVFLVGVLVMTPVGAQIQNRLDTASSNETRTNLGLQTVESVSQASPVVGLGSTRNVQGSFSSIAGGETASCPLCSPPALGTQGHLWLVVFSSGFGGLVLYLGFFVMQFARHVRLHSDLVTVGLAVIIAHAVTLPVYDSVGPSMFFIMGAVGLLWRADLEARTNGATRSALGSGPTVGGYLGMLRAHRRLIAVFMVLGLIGGAAWPALHGTPSTATLSVLVPPEPTYVAKASHPVTIDTEAQFANSTSVSDAILDAVSHDAKIDPDRLEVTATPNTRILHLTYSAANPKSATSAVTAAANALLQLRARNMQARQAAVLKALRLRADALDKAIKTVDTSGVSLKSSTKELNLFGKAELLRRTNQELLSEAGQVGSQIAQATSIPLDVGHLVRPATVTLDTGRWLVALASGMMLGLLVALLTSLLRDAVTVRVRRAKDITGTTGLPILAEVPGALVGDPRIWLGEATSAARLFRAASCLGVGNDATSVSVARRLNRVLDESGTSRPRGRPASAGDPHGAGRLRGKPADQSVVLVASSRTRVRSVLHVRDGLELTGSTVAGLVLVND